MATGGKGSRLTNRQIMQLAAALSPSAMKSLAQEYLGLSTEVIETEVEANKDDKEGFNRGIIMKWANKNPGNQVQVNGYKRIVALNSKNKKKTTKKKN